MNILIAANYATPQSGNFIASMVALNDALRQQGDTLYFVFPDCPNTRREGSWVSWLQEEGCTVHLVQREQSEAARLQELQEIIREHRINVLHIHFAMYQDLILTHRKALPVKIVVHDHADFAADKPLIRQKAYNLLLSLRYRLKGIGMISVSARRNSSYRFCKHWHVPNGLSRRRHVAHSRTREECREALGIRPEDRVCLFLGWALRLKGLDIACKAIGQLRQHDPQLVLAIVGVGNPPTEKAQTFLRTQAGVDPQAPWIRYLPDAEDMFAYHRMADVYLSASRTEGFSYGVLEAIAENTPVAFSDIPGTRWAQAYDHGFMYPVEDPAACAQALSQALAAGRSASNAAQMVEAYSIDLWCQRMIGIYRSL